MLTMVKQDSISKYYAFSKQELDKELKELQAEMAIRRDKANQEYQEIKKQYYINNIEGNLFIGDKTTWSGYDDSMQLIKPISSDDWYSCKCHIIKVFFAKDMTVKDVRHSIYENHRIDMFDTHAKKCTPELYDQFMDKILGSIKKTVNSYNVFNDGK